MKARQRLWVVSAAVLGTALVVGWAIHERSSQEAMAEEARELLFPDFGEVSELERIDIATALEVLRRAQDSGDSRPETAQLLHYGEALDHFIRRDLVFAHDSLKAAGDYPGLREEIQVLEAAVWRAQGETRKARRALRDVRADHPRARLLGADLDLDEGRGGEALLRLRKLVRAYPTLALLHNRIGVAQESMGSLERAEASYLAATDLGDSEYDPWVNLGRLRHQRGEVLTAVSAFDRALDIEPAASDALLGRGLARISLGEHEAALLDLERARHLRPSDVTTHLAVGDAQRGSDPERAVATYRSVVQDHPDSLPAWVRLGNGLVSTGEFHDAERAFREAIRLDEDESAAHNGLGVAVLSQGRFQEALAPLRTAAELDEEDPNPLRNLVRVYRELGDDQMAAEAQQAAEDRLFGDDAGELAWVH